MLCKWPPATTSPRCPGGRGVGSKAHPGSPAGRLSLAQGHQFAAGGEAIQPTQRACLSRQRSGRWHRLAQRTEEEVEGTSLQGLGGAKLGPADAPHVSTHHPLGTRRVSGQRVSSAQAQRSPQRGPQEAGLLLQPQAGHEAGRVTEGTRQEPKLGFPTQCSSKRLSQTLLLGASPGASQQRKLIRDLILLCTPSILCR